MRHKIRSTFALLPAVGSFTACARQVAGVTGAGYGPEQTVKSIIAMAPIRLMAMAF